MRRARIRIFWGSMYPFSWGDRRQAVTAFIMMCHKISEMPLKLIEIPAHSGKREEQKIWFCPSVEFMTLPWGHFSYNNCMKGIWGRLLQHLLYTALGEEKNSVAWLRLIQLLLSIYSFFLSDFAFGILTQTTPFPPSFSSPLFLPDEQFKQQTVPLLHSHQWLHSKSCPCSYFLGRAIFSECICFFS